MPSKKQKVTFPSNQPVTESVEAKLTTALAVMEQSAMPESTVPPVQKTDAELLATFNAEHPDAVTVLPSATEADALRSTQPANGKSIPKPEKHVEPKRFKFIKTVMNGIDCYTVPMTFEDIEDYCNYAEEYYDEEDKSVITHWQRDRAPKRVKSAAAYLKMETAFFPPIICVPDSPINLIAETDAIDSMLVEPHSLPALDGQHRRAGILLAIEQAIDAAHGNENDETVVRLRSQTMPIVVLDIPDNRVDLRQQIFADINKSAAKVTKSLSLLFDHASRVVNLAKKIANQEYLTKDGNCLVEMGKTSPLRKVYKVMSFTNLHNLIEPLAMLKDKNLQPLVSDELMLDIVKPIIDNLPWIDRVRSGSGQWEFGNLKETYVNFFSTMWQGIGKAMATQAKADYPTGEKKYPIEDFPHIVGQAMRAIGSAKTGWAGWTLTEERWGSANRIVVQNGKKMLTQRENIDNASAIICDAFPASTVVPTPEPEEAKAEATASPSAR